MIIDRLENIGKYENVLPRMKDAIAFFLENRDKFSTPGKITDPERFPNNEVYMSVQAYEPKASPVSVCESHRRYADVQIVLEGEEVHFTPNAALSVTNEYDGVKDCSFYDFSDEKAIFGANRIDLPEKTFAVYLPGELHAPGYAVPDTSVTVRKVVVKVLVD